MTGAAPVSIGERGGAVGSPAIDVVVRSREVLADRVVELRLGAADGGPLPPWEPGAHIDVVLAGDLVRQYSLCGDPADLRTYRIAVLREAAGRGGSAEVHDAVHVGSRLTVRGPRNRFPLIPDGEVVFLAGGIGITPLLPMLAAVDAQRRDWVLYYGGRTRSSMAFLDELERYRSRVVVVPQDEHGLLDLADIVGVPRPGNAVYCCGPAGLIDAVEGFCAAWPDGSLHVERFTAAPDRAEDEDADVEVAGFEVVCQASGVTLQVPPGRSILETAEEAGLRPLSSCTEGICGTCETAVIDGEPDHRDELLTPEERASGATMMICVSRARGARLVLDL